MKNSSFAEALLLWFQKNRRNLPWRETQDPYKIWISEVMLQQTPVKTVIPYYKKWIREFPDIKTLSRIPLRNVLKFWEGLGYYNRAENLLRTAKTIATQYQGNVPRDYSLLLKLPGFGPYTAAAVSSIAFSQPVPVIDANARRVVSRLLELKSLSRHSENKINKFLSCHLKNTDPGQFNQAVMELGALVCRSRNPDCLLCPVIYFCRAYASGSQEVIPPFRKMDYQKIEAVAGVIRKGSLYFIQQRPSNGLLGGLWEFPGGKKETGESPEKALKREIREETGMEVIQTEPLITVKHAYTQFRVTLHAFSCKVKNFSVKSGNGIRWVTLEEMKDYPFPSGSVKIIRHLKSDNS